MRNDFPQITKGKGLRIPHSGFRIADSSPSTNPTKTWRTVNKLTFTAFSLFFAVMAYKCASNLAPKYLCAKFKKRSSVHNRTTRNNEKFEIPLFRSATGQRTFAYRAVSLWNTLDEDLRNATTVKAFKKAVKLVMNE